MLFQWARGSAVLDGIMSEFKYLKTQALLQTLPSNNDNSYLFGTFCSVL